MLKDLITRPPLTISLNSTIVEAAKLMRKENVGSLLVVENEKPIGIITERDIVQAIADEKPLTTKVSEVMSTNLVTAESTMDEGEAALLMSNMKIRHLVVTEKGKIIGVVSLRDIARALGLIATDASVW